MAMEINEQFTMMLHNSLNNAWVIGYLLFNSSPVSVNLQKNICRYTEISRDQATLVHREITERSHNTSMSLDQNAIKKNKLKT